MDRSFLPARSVEDSKLGLCESTISRIKNISRLLDFSDIAVYNEEIRVRQEEERLRRVEFLKSLNEAETSREIEDLVKDWKEEFDGDDVTITLPESIEAFLPHIDLSLFTYSIHVEKISAGRHGENFAGVDTSLNINEAIFEHYTQILFLIQEMGHPEPVESIHFTRDELMDFYERDVLGERSMAAGIFDGDMAFIGEFPDRINSFIRNYCRLEL